MPPTVSAPFLPDAPTPLDVRMIPGWGGSGPTHWQSHWERLHPEIRRVEQDDWEAPRLDAWVDRLASAVQGGRRPVVLIAHSLGCCAVLHAAGRGLLGVVRGAFLVAMPDPTRPDFPSQLAEFAPLPTRPLPFPAMVVGSTNDPYTSSDALAGWAATLGARWVNVGPRHHLGDASGVGAWEEGQALFASFAASLEAP